MKLERQGQADIPYGDIDPNNPIKDRLLMRKASGRLVVGFVLLGVALGGCAPLIPVTTLAQGNTGRIAFQSLTLREDESLTLTKEGKPAVIWGDLRLPRQGAGRVPAVVLVHGSGGVSPVQEGWATELNGSGIASFVVDSFSGRGIQEIYTGRYRFNTGTMIIDAYRALELLSTHPRIDPNRIAVMGFSYGGRVVLWASHARFQRLWKSGDEQFAAYLAFYPAGCFIRLRDEERGRAPVRIFHGTGDDWTPIGPCRTYVERMRQAGHDIALVEYPDAPHSFDNTAIPPLVRLPQALNPAGCDVVERADGQIVERDTGVPYGPGGSCLSRGASVGFHSRAYQQAIRDVRDFLYATFGMGR